MFSMWEKVSGEIMAKGRLVWLNGYAPAICAGAQAKSRSSSLGFAFLAIPIPGDYD